MRYLIRFFPELTIKTHLVRHRLIQVLLRNLRIILRRLSNKLSVTADWDILEVQTADDNKILEQQVLDILLSARGTSLVKPLHKLPFVDREQAAAEVLRAVSVQLRGRTFAVRFTRQAEHPFASIQGLRQIGALLMRENDEPAQVIFCYQIASRFS